MVAREFDPYGSLGKEPLIDTIERMRDAVTVVGQGRRRLQHRVRAPRSRRWRCWSPTASRRSSWRRWSGASERQVSNAYEFIEKQLEGARTQLEQKEAALRAYKEQHMGQLPEQVQANLATLQRLQLEQQTTCPTTCARRPDTLRLLESGGNGTGDGRSGQDAAARLARRC